MRSESTLVWQVAEPGEGLARVVLPRPLGQVLPSGFALLARTRTPCLSGALQPSSRSAGAAEQARRRTECRGGDALKERSRARTVMAPS